MRVGAWQFDVRRSEVEANWDAVARGIEAAREQGIALLVLPEMWPTSFAEPTTEIVEASERAVERLARETASTDLVVCGSAYASVPGGGRPCNRLHLVGSGRSLLTYDKVHLFSPTAEDETFAAGAEPPRMTAAAGCNVTGVVCYDLRFGELLERGIATGADILVCPAQWPDTRASHWRALVHGRAVEGQWFVVAANRTGTDEVGRRRLPLRFPGNSLVVDPHGRTLAEGRGEPGLIQAEIDPDVARSLRVRVPVRKDRREDLYRRWGGSSDSPDDDGSRPG